MAAPEGWAPNQDVFARTLMALAEKDDRITVVTSDSRGSGKLVPYGHAYPKQIVEVGIAEQNLWGLLPDWPPVAEKYLPYHRPVF